MLLASFLSSSFVLTLSYPFDLACSRISADMTRFNHKRIYQSIPNLFSQIVYEDGFASRMTISKLYKGFSYAIIGALPYHIVSLVSIEYIDKKNELNLQSSFFSRFRQIFMHSLFVNAFISIFIYPFDTMKRRCQVNGGLGFTSEMITIRSEVTSIDNIRKLYR